MQLPPRITFRGLGVTDGLEADIRERIDKLEKYYRPIVGCRVLLERAERRHEAGNQFHVRIDLTIPGKEIVVAHQTDAHATAQDIELSKVTKRHELNRARKHASVALREAFEAARRQLQDYRRQQRSSVKMTGYRAQR